MVELREQHRVLSALAQDPGSTVAVYRSPA
jgi:hypothetical protein